MALRFLIPGALRPFTDGRATVIVEWTGGSAGEALAALWSACPGLRSRIVNEQGEARPHVNIFVGAESLRTTGGLSTPVPEDAEIAIIPAVSGGCN
jgi:sulfur-carrier protein